MEGSDESRAKRRALSPVRPDARMIWDPHGEPLVSELRIRTIRSQQLVGETVPQSRYRSDWEESEASAFPTKRMAGAPALNSAVVSVYVCTALSSAVLVIVIRVFQVDGGVSTRTRKSSPAVWWASAFRTYAELPAAMPDQSYRTSIW